MVNGLIERARAAKARLDDSSLPNWRRLPESLSALSGLELSRLSQDAKAKLEEQLVDINEITGRYTIETDEDYECISENDLDELLARIEVATTGIIDDALEQIIGGLAGGTSKLPVEAILAARQHRDLIIPRLVKLLSESAVAARAGELPEGNAHFMAVFLLTEFQAQEAFPTILEAFLLPGELPFDLFGDAVTSTLARILAQFVGDRLEVIDSIIENQEANEYVRWEAAQTYEHLVRDGRMSRGEAVRRLQELLNKAVDRRDIDIADKLVSILTTFAPLEARDDIRSAYDRGIVFSDILSWEDVEDSIAAGEEGMRKALGRCAPTGIADTISELQHWASFREQPPTPKTPSPPAPAAIEKPAVSLPTHVAPVTSASQRPGRNEPCPCGSGKKFKKCCLIGR